jgi:hypothetical protein
MSQDDGVSKLEGASERMRDAGNGYPKRRGRPRKQPSHSAMVVPAPRALALQTSAPPSTPPSMRVPDTDVAVTWLPPRLLDVHAAAKYLSVSQWAIRDLHAAGKLPRVRLALDGDREVRRLLFDLNDLNKLVDRSREDAR